MHSEEQTLALREQFDTAAQQRDASTLGMWIFLITEVLFFGVLLGRPFRFCGRRGSQSCALSAAQYFRHCA